MSNENICREMTDEERMAYYEKGIEKLQAENKTLKDTISWLVIKMMYEEQEHE